MTTQDVKGHSFPAGTATGGLVQFTCARCGYVINFSSAASGRVPAATVDLLLPANAEDYMDREPDVEDVTE